MGKITIQFVGICTHIKDLVPGVPHRVVMVHEDEAVVLNGFPVHSHAAKLTLSRGEVLNGSGPLPTLPHRLVLSIKPRDGEGPPTYDPNYQCIYSLSRLAGAAVTLSDKVVIDQSPPASIYFDVTQGHFSAGFATKEGAKGAIGAVLVVETDGDPVLVITEMDDDKPPLEIVLSTDSILSVCNEAIADGTGTHINADFLLHYLTTHAIPPGDPFPVQTPTRCTALPDFPIKDPSWELGPGCSNSQYP